MLIFFYLCIFIRLGFTILGGFFLLHGVYLSCKIHVNLTFPQVTWSDIAGLDDVITDLKDTVILPIKKKHLFENSRLLQPPKGIVQDYIC